MAVETELKYLDVDFARLRGRLFELGAVSGGAHFESNVLLDTPGALLCGQGKLLRLRKQEWPSKTRCLATFKKPLELASPVSAPNGVVSPKTREELEFEVGDFESCLAVFENLGYEIWVRYEKIRESFRLNLSNCGERPGEVEVELDRLNFISVVEIEGTGANLMAAERLLDLDNFKKSSTNYHKLHQEWLKKNGRSTGRDFVFEASEKKRLRMELGLK